MIDLLKDFYKREKKEFDGTRGSVPVDSVLLGVKRYGKLPCIPQFYPCKKVLHPKREVRCTKTTIGNKINSYNDIMTISIIHSMY